MRLFIAIDLPDNLKEKINQSIKILRKCDIDAKWVQDKNLHLSLKFLGETDQEKLAEIKKIINLTAQEYQEIELYTESFGFFPNEIRPRVFFLGTDKGEELKRIAVSLEGRLEKLGFIKENRFAPHITLARLKSIKNISGLKSELKNISVKEKIPVSEIALFQSILKSCCSIRIGSYNHHDH